VDTGLRSSVTAKSQTGPFGPDQPCLHWDLLKIIYCHESRSAGRDDRNLQFTNLALTPEQRQTACP